MWERPSFDALEAALADPCHPIGMRMRAAYYLRQIHHDSRSSSMVNDDNHPSDNDNDGNTKDNNNGNNIENKDPAHVQERVVQVLTQGLQDVRHGSLMRHEFAYVLGQLRDERACDALERVLGQADDCVMVRHECAEALGAIGAERSRSVLQEQVAQQTLIPAELSETCQLALNVMDWRSAGGDLESMPAACACMLNPYSSVDPAPPHPAHANTSLEELGDLLLSPSRPMFERYRAMFSLRNRGGTDAVLQLCRALTDDVSSALLRHEVAYVLGQMQHAVSVEALEISLRRLHEHKMVRHESAEALGAIEGRWEDVQRILQEFSHDPDDVVRESCLVALDAADYWGHSNNNNTEAGEEDGEEQQQENKAPLAAPTVSFTQQKNHDPHLVVVNHFNLQTTAS